MSSLRAVNAALLVAHFALHHALLRRLHAPAAGWPLALRALALTLFPLQFFYSFLFYTDAASTAAVLLAYLLALARRPHLAALAGLAALMFRQTNVVWLAVALAAALLTDAQPARPPKPRDAPAFAQALAADAARVVRHAVSQPRAVLGRYGSGAAVGAAFAAFVAWNGALVLGDKAHHAAALHLPQLLYFVAVAAASLHVRLLGPLSRLSLASLASLPSLALLAFALVAVHRFSYAHPYLLADNRHYSFYVWRLVTRFPPYSPYACALLYWLAAHLLARLPFRAPALLRALFFVATAAVLVPSPLLELRYFALPTLLLLLHLAPSSGALYALDVALFAAVNALTLFAFLYRPFRWPDGQEARFMW